MSTTTRDRAIADAFKVARDPWRFPELCRITRLNGSVGGIEMTPTQRVLMEYFVQFSWTYVVKYRQAMSSIIHLADQLRYISYNPGRMGMIIGDKEPTSKELMRRQGVMYNSLNPLIQTPLARPTSSEIIMFDKPHEGLIQGITGGGENPAIGFSPDYAVISEYGLYENHTAFDGAFFPAIDRRENAVCRIETTPGVYNSSSHEMYKEALLGKGLFQAVFLPWWRDEAVKYLKTPMPEGWSHHDWTGEEKEYAKNLLMFETNTIKDRPSWYRFAEPHPIRPEQMWFRQKAMETHFHNDPRLFATKFPPSPHEGWSMSESPTIPAEPLQAMLRRAVSIPYGEERFYEEREAGCPYLITIDGKGYGKKGDPAAMTLWNMWDWREAGSWSGDEDPGQITPRILRWQAMYDATVIVETNKDGVAAALQAANCPNLHWSGAQPGWYSTQLSKATALNNLVDMLRAGDADLRTYETIDQLMKWDGKTRAQESGKRKHHFDRAITCLIFAYGVSVLGHQRRPKPPTPEDQRITMARFLASYAEKPKGRVLGE
jgi:hypothetical protein